MGADADHRGDLELARAVSAGDPDALRTFDGEILGKIDPALAGISDSPQFTDEIRQQLRVRLLVGDATDPPRIQSYRGTGSLLAWVRIAAVRLALNQKRSQRPTVSPDDMLSELVAREPDPELRHMKSLYRAEYAEALRAAVAALGDRDRAVLRLHYVDGLRLAQIAALYKVGESTVSRWVHKAVGAIAEDARARLRERLRLSPETAESVARMVASNLDLSIGRMLREP